MKYSACITTLIVLTAASTQGEMYAWGKKDANNSAYVSGPWTTASNWVLEDGTIPETYPGEGDTVSLPTGLNKNSVREITLSFSSTNSLGTIKGGPGFTIALNVPRNNDKSVVGTVKIENPNDFEGAWRTVQPRTEIYFENDETFTPRLASLSSQARPHINVSKEGSRVKIGLLHAKDDANAFYTQDVTVYAGGGALAKLGAGTLEIEEAAGIEERIHVNEGTLALNGHPNEQTSVEEILSRAYMRLDATRRDTMMTYTGDDGRLYVTNWADVNGSGRSAYSEKLSNVPTYSSDFPKIISNPFISPVKSSSGLDLMDFGSTSEENVDRLGPLHGILRFNECKDVRELFIVRWVTDGNATYNSVIGHTVAYPLHTGGKYVMFDSNANSGVSAGVIRVNGVKAFWGYHPPADQLLPYDNRIHLLNIAPTNAISLNLLGSERHYSLRTGGCRIGEVLIFTKQLTEGERAQINKYLMTKWFKGYTPCDVGAVTLKDNTSIEVPEGRTAHIHRLSLFSDTLVKIGGGTLVVDSISPANAKIDIKGGNVIINPSQIVATTDKPADNPLVWLDATATETMLFSNSVDNTQSFLTNWSDKAGGPIHATPPWTSSIFTTNFPTVKQDVPAAGLAVVDFGNTGGAEKDSWMWLSTRGRIAKEGFIVYRNTIKNWGNQFGSSSTEFMRNAYAHTAQMIDPVYVCARVAASQWTRDGAVEDPFSNRKAYSYGANAPFSVISFAAADKVQADLLAKDRLIERSQGIGAIQIAEMILYDRRLSAAERRNTEAYLINRWQSTSYPTPSTSYTFNEKSDRIFYNESDITVTNIIGGTANYVKYGGGNVSFSLPSPYDNDSAATPSFKIYDGSLNFSYTSLKPIFRFDASVDSFEGEYTTEEGKKYFTQWNDPSSRDVYATVAHPKNQSGGILTEADPSLVELETRTGVKRRVVDFGSGTTSARAGMYMSQKFKNVREAFTVLCDREGQCLFCSRETYNFLRGWTTYRQLFHNYNDITKPTVNGYIAVDGIERPYNYVPSVQFHVFNSAPTNNTQIDSLAIDRNVTGGGMYIGEQFAFSQKLSPAYRNAITKSLQHKWFEECNKPCFTNEISSVELFGGSLTVEIDEDEFFIDRTFLISSLIGTGSISTPALFIVKEISALGGALNIDSSMSLAPNASVNANFDENGNLNQITIDGTLKSQDDVSVNIEPEDVSALRYGEYKLFEANALDEVDTSTWKVDRSLLPQHMAAYVRAKDNIVYIDLKSQGTLLILR